MAKPPPDLIRLRKCKPRYQLDHNYFMPNSRDVTAKAHRLHKEARRDRA